MADRRIGGWRIGGSADGGSAAQLDSLELELELERFHRHPNTYCGTGVRAGSWASARTRTTGWRKEYGGLRVDQARRLKELERERENGRLKKLLAETMLDNAILKEVSSGNF